MNKWSHNYPFIVLFLYVQWSYDLERFNYAELAVLVFMIIQANICAYQSISALIYP